MDEEAIKTRIEALKGEIQQLQEKFNNARALVERIPQEIAFRNGSIAELNKTLMWVNKDGKGKAK